MPNLYPTLEDLKVDSMIQAQHQVEASYGHQYPAQHAISAPGQPSAPLYPSLDDYMGLNLQQQIVQHQSQLGSGWSVVSQSSGPCQVVAPITEGNLGVARAEIKQGMRPLTLCKDVKGKLGVVVQGVNKGVFVCFVYADSPASLGGLRFGDQILEINGHVVAGWSTDKAMTFLKKAAPDRITMVVRDRPLARTITMNKNSEGYIGFLFKNGKITKLVQDSSAARNGLLTEHNLVEVNGVNVVGLKDKDIQNIIDKTPRTVTVTVMPSFIYDHIIKSLDSGMMKKHMDHSVPEI